MSRFLAIDPGDKRTGLAVADDLLRLASPVGVIQARGIESLLQAIDRAIAEHRPDALVVGIPLNMDGSIGPAARKAQALADRLAERTGLPVHRVDERLTSFQADQQMKDTGWTRRQKKARRDALAAAAILNDFLAGL